MHPVALKLAAKFIIVPLFCATSLVIPKHFNTAHYPQGNYKGYLYSAKVFDHPVYSGINGGRVQMLKLYKDGKLIADFTEGWRIGPPKESVNDFQEIAKLLNSQAE
jgi:hypothetical protein